MALTTAQNPTSQSLAAEALSLESQGRLDESIEAWHKAIALAPNRADYHHTLGDVLRTAHRIDDAIACYRIAAELKPDLAATWCNLCSLLRMKGDLAGAVKSGRRAVEIDPKLGAGHNNLAIALLDLGETRQALGHCRSALTAAPQSIAAHRTTARALASAGETELALNHLRIALQLQPENAEIAVELGDLLRDMGRLDEAAAEYQKVAQHDPQNVEAGIGLVKVFVLRGEHQRAWTIAEQVCREHPDNLAASMAVVELHQHFKRHDAATQLIQKCLAQPTISPAQRRALLFALGDSLDRLKQFDAAWDAYHQANALKPVKFDQPAFAAHLESLTTAFSPSALVSLPRAASPSTRSIFIAGMPRSGTTLIEQILASHPQVKGVGEMGLMSRVIGRIGRLTKATPRYPQCIASFTQTDMDALATFCNSEILRLAASHSCVVEKTPDNFLHIGLIRLLFPEAIIVHAQRDPLDTCLSCFFHDFVGHHQHAYRLEDLGGYHRQQEQVMNFWRDSCDIPILNVAYEDVVADLRGQTERMLTFCNLPWDDRCLQFHQSDRAVHTASREQVRQPIYASSVQRWKNYEKHLPPLIDSLYSCH